MPNIEWKKVLDGVDEALKFFNSQNVKPTLRTLFYNLYSKQLLPNTKTAYQSLSKHLVDARKEGRYSWDMLEDRTRNIYGEFKDGLSSDNIAEKFETDLDEKLENFDLESIIDEYFDYLRPYAYVNRWAKQKQVCEIWIEKEALASTLVNWTSQYDIAIRINKGYSSWTFIYNNAEALKEVLQNHEKITIFYLGDLDPSGVDIERFLKEALEYFELDPSDVELIRLGVTGDQVEKYNLPPRPEDSETLAKLERDPRSRTYLEQYTVELDSLVAYVPSEFHRLVDEAILSVWDQDVYDVLVTKAKARQLEVNDLLETYKDKARDKLRDLLNDQ